MLKLYVAQWIALGILFLLASAFSERTAKYGYVLIPLLAGLFAYFGWLQGYYLITIVPLLLSMGVITFLKEQFRLKLGGIGSNTSLIWKIVYFLMVLQIAIVFVNGMGIYGAIDKGKIVPDSTMVKNTDSWNIYNANSTEMQKFLNPSIQDQVGFFFTLVVQSLTLLFNMIVGTLGIYWTLINVFGVPPSVSAVLSSIVWIMFLVEVLILFAKPYSAPKA
jgi:hypothetical protein